MRPMLRFGIVVSLSITLTGCSPDYKTPIGVVQCVLTSCTPDNTTKIGFASWKPNAGFRWIDPDSVWNLGVIWNPGVPHPTKQNIVSGNEQYLWLPAPGYRWKKLSPLIVLASSFESAARSPVHTETGEFGSAEFGNVEWYPGSKHPYFSHVIASESIDRWLPDDGYGFVNPEKDLTASWKVGIRSNKRPHFFTTAQEGVWQVDPGYINNNNEFAVWRQGLTHPEQPCIVSSSMEGTWLAVAGYHIDFTNDVARIVANSKSTGPDWGKVLIGGVVAIIGYTNSQTHDDDNVVDSVGHHVAGKVGEIGLELAGKGFETNSGACDGVILNGWKKAV